MKTKFTDQAIKYGALIVFGASTAIAQVNYPPFLTVTNTVAIPTNSPAFQPDSTAVVDGTNVIYTFRGQFFTNTLEGRIPTTTNSIVGSTDKSTPWKTLTELLSAYTHGATSNNLATLYSPDSQWFLDTIFTNSTTETRFGEYAASITNMSVLVGVETNNDYAVVTSIHTTDSSEAEALPFFLRRTPGSGTNFVYLLSARDPVSPMEANIVTYIDSNSVTNIQEQ